MTYRRTLSCMDDELSEYAAGRLGEQRRRLWERHLVACQLCGQAVREERRLREALAGSPAMPRDLRVALLAMGRDSGLSAPREATAGPEPLALLGQSAPACHRSALRATVVAAAAAGASAAAAWSLTVAGAPVSARPADSGIRTPAVSPAGASPRQPSPAVGAAFVSIRWMSGTSPTARPARPAESTP